MPAKLGENTLNSVTLRLDLQQYREFEKIMALAGLGSGEAVRHAIESAVERFNNVDLTGLKIDSEFAPKIVSNYDSFPELLGHLHLTVTPPATLGFERLNEMVFVLPEFFDGNNEPYRVDNAYFQRIVVNNKHVDSKKTRARNVLSFRLIEGKWSGSLFDYSGAGSGVIVQKVIDAMKEHIVATLKCALIGQLPQARHLTAAEVANLNALHMPQMNVS
jgi:hypothetical protein